MCSYPKEAAATRFRLLQYTEPLFRRGIELVVRPMLSSEGFAALYGPHRMAATRHVLSAVARRLADLGRFRQFDVILVQREAMIFGPPAVEQMIRVARKPLVLDLDDATYVRYRSPTYSPLVNWLKFFGKTDRLIDMAHTVVCGNAQIAAYVEGRGGRAAVVPTLVDTEVFRPQTERPQSAPPVVGWVGSHSTYPFLERILPALSTVAASHPFRLLVVGSGVAAPQIPGLVVDYRPWSLNRELADFTELDIGLYPIDENRYGAQWAQGKSGFKAIQYFAAGVPAVVSPVGECATMGRPGTTHLLATTLSEWTDGVVRLLDAPELRREMSRAARAHAMATYGLDTAADVLAAVLNEAADG